MAAVVAHEDAAKPVLDQPGRAVGTFEAEAAFAAEGHRRIAAAIEEEESLLAAPERGAWLSPVLTDAVADTLARGEQALLFLNRRGYAPVTLCRKCGFRFECPNCSAWLVEHRFRRR